MGQQIAFSIELNQRIAAYGIRAIDGNGKIGEYTNDKRYDYVQNLSSDFVEIVASKVKILHKIMIEKIQEGQIANF
jgi:translation initiation factor IF-3